MDPISPVTPSSVISQYSRAYNIDANRTEVRDVKYIESQGQVRVEVTSKTYDKYGTITEYNPPTIDIKA